MSAYEVKISYNPYTVKTAIEVNGKPHSGLMEQVRNRRLSQWIDWLLPEILEELNTRAVKLVFEGTVLDEEDVRDAINLLCTANDDVSLDADYIACDRSVDDRVNAIKALFDEAQNGPIDEFRSPSMHAAFNRAFTPEFEVNVLATMSAGKSTLINAMLGMELMPSKNEACTATIAKIHDYDDMNIFEAKRYDHDDQLLDDWTVVFDPNSAETTKRPTLLEEWNNDKTTSRIEVRGDIPAIKERDQVRLVLVDTPGPNNSRDDSHREATIRAITSSLPSMALYVLNAQNLGVKDDKSLLGIIRETMEEGGREAQDRFIFVANKIDVFDPERGELVSHALKNVKNYLEENGIHNPLVIPASAELTMMLRTVNARGKEALTRNQRGRLSTAKELFLEEEEMDLLEHVKNDIGRQAYTVLKDQAEQGDHDRKVEIRSGIPVLEQLLENYISKHALPVRLKDVVDSFSAIAREVKQVQALNNIIRKSEQEISEMVELINYFQSDQKRLDQAKIFREEVKAAQSKPSEKNKETINNTKKAFSSLMDQLSEDFKCQLSNEEAQEKIKRAEDLANNLLMQNKFLYEQDLKDDLTSRLNILRTNYEAYVADVLQKSFPDNVTDEVLSLQSAALEMKSVDEMINSGGVELISQTDWYNPFSWFRNGKLKAEDILEIFRNDLRSAMDQNEIIFKNSLIENFESLKIRLLSEMDEIDAKLGKILEELVSCENDKKQKEEKIKECLEKLEWYDAFQNNLNNVLSIAVEKTGELV